MKLTKLCPALAVSVIVSIGSQAQAVVFTGPISPYYLNNYAEHKIYVVQGASVINQFAWAYGAGNPNNLEGNLAVTNVVTTNGLGSAYGLTTAGQYTLTGTPTGTSHLAQATPSADAGSEHQYDGTSDGRYNYTVQYDGKVAGIYTENVIRTDLNWQNPTVLFSVQSPPPPPGAHGEYMGIAYDSTNTSLWISGFNVNMIGNYSLSGTLLSSFTGPGSAAALGLDPADNTLWLSYSNSNLLEQWSKSGNLLQSANLNALPGGTYYAGEFAVAVPAVPEPGEWALMIAGLAVIGARVRLARHRFALPGA